MSSLSLQETLCYCGFCVCLLGSRLYSQTLRNVAVFACAAAIVFWIRSRATKETKTFLLFLSYTQTGEDFRERWCQGKSAKKVCSLTRDCRPGWKRLLLKFCQCRSQPEVILSIVESFSWRMSGICIILLELGCYWRFWTFYCLELILLTVVLFRQRTVTIPYHHEKNL